MLSMICILGRNRAIGRDGELLWKIPSDMTHFKNITMGHTLIIGRKTHESIGRPLPGRTNIVLSRKAEYKASGCIICHSLEDALNKAGEDEVFIIGGSEVYEQALPLAEKLYLTVVDDEPEADTFFPDYSMFQTCHATPQLEYNGLKYRHLELKQ